ncbi:MAG: hypothetical protein OEW18_07995, partial [Candidatus Aminicenantes bacterium]|nr:hypothetical protein [Candidatus Aminicenantes bacterium]
MKTKFYITVAATILLHILCRAQQSEYTIKEIGQCKTGVAYDVFTEENYAYVTTNHGVSIIYIKDKIHPKVIGKVKTNTPTFGVFARSQKLYTVTLDGQFTISEIQNP